MRSNRRPWQVRTLQIVASLAMATYLMHAFSAGQDNIIDAIPAPPSATLDDATPKKTERLMSALDDQCWQSDDEPLAALPGAAIVRIDGHTRYTLDHTLVDLAFSEVLGDSTRRLDVVALCK